MALFISTQWTIITAVMQCSASFTLFVCDISVAVQHWLKTRLMVVFKSIITMSGFMHCNWQLSSRAYSCCSRVSASQLYCRCAAAAKFLRRPCNFFHCLPKTHTLPALCSGSHHLSHQRNYSMSNPVSAEMGDHLWVGTPAWYVTKSTRST